MNVEYQTIQTIQGQVKTKNIKKIFPPCILQGVVYFCNKSMCKIITKSLSVTKLELRDNRRFTQKHMNTWKHAGIPLGMSLGLQEHTNNPENPLSGCICYTETSTDMQQIWVSLNFCKSFQLFLHHHGFTFGWQC